MLSFNLGQVLVFIRRLFW